MKLRTHLPIDECRARLESAIDPERFAFTPSGHSGSREILGSIGDSSFRLQKRRTYRNSFAPFFYGRFRAADSGTLIDGECRMHLVVKVFMGYWFSFVVLAACFGIVSFLSTDRVHREPGAGILSVLFPAALFAFGFGLVTIGRWLARDEEQAILTFLKDTLEATEVV